MYVLIIIHGPTPDDNEYYGPFDTEDKAHDYVERLERDQNTTIRLVDYSVQSMGSLQ